MVNEFEAYKKYAESPEGKAKWNNVSPEDEAFYEHNKADSDIQIKPLEPVAIKITGTKCQKCGQISTMHYVKSTGEIKCNNCFNKRGEKV